LGTTAVVVVAEAGALAPAVMVVQDVIDAFDRACSRFRPDAELVRLCARAGTTVEVSPLLFDAIEVALDAAAVTEGLLDPTVGTAIRLLGYDRDFASVSRDGGPLRARAARVPGWQAVSIDSRASTVRVPAGVELDLGATAKALCADRAAAVAVERTGAGVLVSLGGDVAVAGPAPTRGWPVRVTDDHAAPRDGEGEAVAISSGGLATSSTTVRTWRRGSSVYHHLLDPETGLPAQSRWRTVSVVAASCVDANIASTASILMDAAAPGWLAARHLPARLVERSGAVVYTPGWPGPDGAVVAVKERSGGREPVWS
jgi:thiamine biosynthesis lipoprotein